MSYRKDLDEFYEKADTNSKYERQWGYINPASAAYWRLRDELVFENILQRFDTLENPLKVLEVGVGHGHELAKLSQLGIPETCLTGIDLVFERLAQAKIVYPSLIFSHQDGTRLAFADDSFDIVCQYACVVHAPTKELQIEICSEMIRVLKPGGIIIWWDIAPSRWRTIAVRRICRLLAGKRGIRAALSTIKDLIFEATIPSHRSRALSKAFSSYLHPISIRDLSQMFFQLKPHAHYVGVDYDIWKYLWERNRIMAQILWRSGWFWQHCFAVIEKPKYSK